MTPIPLRALMLGSLLATAPLAHAAPTAVPAEDAPLKLKALAVSGNAIVPTDELMAAIPFHTGDTVTRAEIAQGADDVGGVYKKHNVGAELGTRATYLGNTVKVTYVISNESAAPPPTKAQLIVDSVSITGNKQVPSDKLNAAIKLHAGAPVTNEDLSADVKAIQQVYKDADVGMSLQPDVTYPQPGHVVIVYKITEK